ncbi:Protein lethal(2)essential for life [Habropoda laboriosa]|uniref:Protein lethal(2)essential for life n=1 Tax=Habropoda laboriosa TaxID=597456 RepID=A0A0L7RHH7_9HYME|nr:Protein lethal(2)essential for life [Habropoda laboriosa]
MRRGITLIPRLFSHWWETLEQSHRLLDQQFAKGIMRPEQFLTSVFERSPFKSFPNSYCRPWIDWEREIENSGWSIIKNDKHQFRVVLDVQQFKPEEVNVKVIDNYIVVEELEDEHGLISRQFVRKYLVPDQCDPEKAASSLSSDGVLTITAPLRPETIESRQGKEIKIEQTGKPSEDEPQKIKQSQ